MISIVAAIGKNREIGRNNDLLWDMPGDRKRFREITLGHPVIWGRKTFESVLSYIHKPPPGRTNIVVTRDSDVILEKVRSLTKTIPESVQDPGQARMTNLIVVESLDAAFEKARKSLGSEEIFLGGGAKLWSQAMDRVDRLYLTAIDAEAPGADAYFPEYESDFTRVVSEESGEEAGLRYKFVVLER